MSPRRPVRIGNCSGFYGDRFAAAKEMVDGGPLDVLCGDYLAELTMLILAKGQAKDPVRGYARTFLGQLEQILGSCLDNGVKVVSNAGGLNPAALAEAIQTAAEKLGLRPRIAYLEGDDLRTNLGAIDPPTRGDVLSANVYLGGWGICQALAAGADVVVTGRVTDASLVVGPAAWWHGWRVDQWDELAGAVVAGHIIECGPQATGGNYCFLDELTDSRPPGFPIAEVSADGSSVITKHPCTGGVVSVGTVTAQLVYEIAAPLYLGPDVSAHFDEVELAQIGPDRVAVHGVRGCAPPERLKVAVNRDGGYRNTMTCVITGLDVERKAAHAQRMLLEILGGQDVFDELIFDLHRFDVVDPPANDRAIAQLRITAFDSDPAKVGRAFSDAVLELAVANYAGLYTTTPPRDATASGIFSSATVSRSSVRHVVVLPDGSREVIADPPTAEQPPVVSPDRRPDLTDWGPTVAAPLGRICGARSGDKGGDANVGIWARTDRAYRWQQQLLTSETVRALVGAECAGLDIDIYPLPNIRAHNVVIHGLLGRGVAANARIDPQAKGLGEYLRSKVVQIPLDLLTDNR